MFWLILKVLVIWFLVAIVCGLLFGQLAKCDDDF